MVAVSFLDGGKIRHLAHDEFSKIVFMYSTSMYDKTITMNQVLFFTPVKMTVTTMTTQCFLKLLNTSN